MASCQVISAVSRLFSPVCFHLLCWTSDVLKISGSDPGFWSGGLRIETFDPWKALFFTRFGATCWKLQAFDNKNSCGQIWCAPTPSVTCNHPTDNPLPPIPPSQSALPWALGREKAQPKKPGQPLHWNARRQFRFRRTTVGLAVTFASVALRLCGWGSKSGRMGGGRKGGRKSSPLTSWRFQISFPLKWA